VADLNMNQATHPTEQAAFVCVRCAALGPTCCEISPGQEECCFPVSELERQRISDHVALSRGGFVEEKNSRAFVANLQRLFPVSAGCWMRSSPPGGRICACPRIPGPLPVPVGVGVRLAKRGAAVLLSHLPVLGRGRAVDCLHLGCLSGPPGGANHIGHAHQPGNTRATVLLDLHRRLRLAWGFPPEEGMAFVTPP
jgi:hypothetical protein